MNRPLLVATAVALVASAIVGLLSACASEGVSSVDAVGDAAQDTHVDGGEDGPDVAALRESPGRGA